MASANSRIVHSSGSRTIIAEALGFFALWFGDARRNQAVADHFGGIGIAPLGWYKAFIVQNIGNAAATVASFVESFMRAISAG
jgi:hypothetical protein